MNRIARAVLFLVGVVMIATPASALTTRHDRNDSDYINLANTLLPQGGAIFGPGWIGSGTLISPTWVLTAGHVADPSATTFSSPAGTRTIINRHVYGGGDVGLVQLDAPINGFDPIRLYDVGRFGVEQGQDALIAGAGNTGTGLTGETGPNGTPRAGQTIVYANASAWGWSSNDLLTWFRSPSDPNVADLEAGSAHGDSGGGLFLNVGGQWSIAGVLSLSWSAATSYGQYDSGGVFVRTGTEPVLDWITTYATDASVVPEPASLAVLVIGAAALSLRRHRRF